MKKETPPKLADLQDGAKKLAEFMREYDFNRIVNTPFKQPSDYRLEGNQLYIATLSATGEPILDVKIYG